MGEHAKALRDSPSEAMESKEHVELGLSIGQDQIDDIEALQSPPNSPGLVIPVMVPSTNDRIDFFALDQTNESEDNSGVNDSKYAGQKTLIRTPSTNMKDASVSRQKRLSNTSQDNVDSGDAIDLNVFTSSDSYFSRARKGKIELHYPNVQESGNKKTSSANRRVSDVSDRSEGGMSFASFGSMDSGSAGSYLTESDTDITASPSAKYVKRRSTSKAFSTGNDTQYDDGIVYRTTSNNVSSDGGHMIPRSLSRSSSKTRNASRDRRSSKDDLKDRTGDDSLTGQIFKNTLILEESLRQQYIYQQSLRYKYSMFLLLLVSIFTYSTYYSVFNSIYVETKNSNLNEINGIKGCEELKANNLMNNQEMKVDETLFCTNEIPRFPSMIATVVQNNNHEGIKCISSSLNVNNQNENKSWKDELARKNLDNDFVEDSGYIFMNIIYRVISIITGMTLVLFYLTGEYTRTISRPRKFLTTANKGIRQLNVRLVKVKVPLKERAVGYLRLHFRKSHHGGVDHVRLVLNPRVFSTATREQWELYRNQFWNLEGVRRLRQQSGNSPIEKMPN
jgi:hypothetical protein